MLEPTLDHTRRKPHPARASASRPCSTGPQREATGQGDNPARWRGHLDKLLPKPRKLKRVQHHPALPYADLPQFMAELRGNNSVNARALEFTILTACRTGEVINASLNEIDLRAKTWTIPAERMKAGKEHKVPLCDRALAHPVHPAARA